ncbi:hypothetical protein WH96_05605 [Kiloniella spongiae]|uniref:Uncharacterized protein n=1 Tax=Kiloniella spongiae TaxID=1489064 RepID=A0A0H2MYF9_9PROT|nr:hypothetical protein WH96_05605 [Kiloniella spongiae]
MQALRVLFGLKLKKSRPLYYKAYRKGSSLEGIVAALFLIVMVAFWSVIRMAVVRIIYQIVLMPVFISMFVYHWLIRINHKTVIVKMKTLLILIWGQ